MTGNQGFGRLAQLRDDEQQEKQQTKKPDSSVKKETKPKTTTPKPKPAPAAAAPLADLEMPDLPEPAAQQQEVTRLLSAQVPQARKLAFDRRVLEARSYYPDLEMKEGVAALLELLDDERIYRLWLHKIGEGKS